jgi:predicted P-loop ATPase
MFKTIIIDLAGLFVIASSIYDMYVNHKIKKLNEQSIEADKEIQKEIKSQIEQLNKSMPTKLDGKEIIKAINEVQYEQKSKLIM